jgi:hypothetical protein
VVGTFSDEMPWITLQEKCSGCVVTLSDEMPWPALQEKRSGWGEL